MAEFDIVNLDQQNSQDGIFTPDEQRQLVLMDLLSRAVQPFPTVDDFLAAYDKLTGRF